MPEGHCDGKTPNRKHTEVERVRYTGTLVKGTLVGSAGAAVAGRAVASASLRLKRVCRATVRGGTVAPPQVRARKG